ncbi:hypothetical protein K4G60_g2698 [Candida parapsilosis]|nr:hypothetical protein K4G60_g2698 [Candida parapsilosis]KAI5909897.1 hypothetical protein K4G61_g3585 [Candida parapsilosis]
MIKSEEATISHPPSFSYMGLLLLVCQNIAKPDSKIWAIHLNINTSYPQWSRSNPDNLSLSFPGCILLLQSLLFSFCVDSHSTRDWFQFGKFNNQGSITVKCAIIVNKWDSKLHPSQTPTEPLFPPTILDLWISKILLVPSINSVIVHGLPDAVLNISTQYLVKVA